MIWEQHGRNFYAKDGQYEYMVSKSTNWGLWRKHVADSRWEQWGTYASAEDAKSGVL